MGPAVLRLTTAGHESGVATGVLVEKPGGMLAEGSRQGHFFLRFRLNCTRCISVAPAMLDRYLAALPAMSLIPFAPFFTADFLASFFALLLESPAAPSPALRPVPCP